MTTLPPGWARTALGDLLLWIESGKSFECQPRPARPDEWGVIKVSAMTWGSFKEDENKAVRPGGRFDPAHEIKAGDILVSRANTQEYVGASVLVSSSRPRLLLSDKSLRLIPASGINRRWLAHLLSSPVVRAEISRRATCTKHSMRNISQQSLVEIEVWVPPVAEQERIVAALDVHLSRMDAGLAGVRSVATRGSILRDRLTEAAAIGGLTTGDRTAAYLAPAGADDGILPSLPIGWRWTRLGDIADVVGGVTKDSKKQSDPSFVEVPYLRVANVQRGRLDLTNITTIRVSPAKAERLYLQVGDVLLNEGGDRDKLGRGWIWEGQIPDCIHQNHVFRARVDRDILHPKLLAWHANGFGKQWCDRNGSQSVNLASISLSKIKLLPVPLPPHEIQDGLVEEVEAHAAALDSAVGAAVTALNRAEWLRRALLSRAIAGRLVGQSRADEPASVLIEKAQVERANSSARRRARGHGSTTRRAGAKAVQETLL